MLIKNKKVLTENDVTDQTIYENRRSFMKTTAGIGIESQQSLGSRLVNF